MKSLLLSALLSAAPSMADEGAELVWRAGGISAGLSFCSVELFLAGQKDVAKMPICEPYQNSLGCQPRIVLFKSDAWVPYAMAFVFPVAIGTIYQASKTTGPFEPQDVAAYAIGSAVGVGVDLLLRKTKVIWW